MQNRQIPLEVFIPEYSKLPNQAKFGLLFLTIIGPCFLSLFFEQSMKLLTGGFTAILDIMLLAIFAIFGSVWLIWIYQVLTRIKQFEFFEEYFVIHWRIGFRKSYKYNNVNDLHTNSVKIGRKVYRFSFFKNGQDLYNIFKNLIISEKIDSNLFSGELEHLENLTRRTFPYSGAIALVVTIILLIFFQFDRAESRLLFPFVWLGIILISYLLIKFLASSK